jgi:uncharacterized membrane protein YhiD involved in acid resistance
MAFLHAFLALSVALAMGTFIGCERRWRQRNTGRDLDHVVGELNGSPRVRSAI